MKLPSRARIVQASSVSGDRKLDSVHRAWAGVGVVALGVLLGAWFSSEPKLGPPPTVVADEAVPASAAARFTAAAPIAESTVVDDQVAAVAAWGELSVLTAPGDAPLVPAPSAVPAPSPASPAAASPPSQLAPPPTPARAQPAAPPNAAPKPNRWGGWAPLPESSRTTSLHAVSNRAAPDPASAAATSVASPHAGAQTVAAATPTGDAAADPHAACFEETLYPSAKKCAECHQQIYEEWALSGHAYAAISPMFHKFEQKITELSQGTVGYFCLRCHSPVGTAVGLPRDVPIYAGPPAAAEGVTCVACHRVAEQYNRVNGERRIEPGDEYAPVFGAGHGAGLAEVLAGAKDWKVKTSPDEPGPGQPIHNGAIRFEQLNRADFCVSCHQVAVHPGIKLEVVWDQYRASPAHRQGITCQDCHMGAVPGKASGYACGPAAIVSGRPTDPNRRHSNHMFFGPGSSIAHPGVYPPRAKEERWTTEQWLAFDWRAGWGTEDFEDAVYDEKIHVDFPPAWQESDDRLDAREILEENFKRLDKKNFVRKLVMENGSHVDGPFFPKARPPRIGHPLDFHYVVENTDLGHNLPSGSLGAQPQVWLNVVLTDPAGRRVWESGHLDRVGDLADLHSDDVLNGRMPHDRQLFNLQTKFLTTNVKGTDREMPLPINFDLDQLPFLRPGAQPISVINHPPFIRMEAHSLPPTAHKKARYRVPAECLTQPGKYTLSVRMRSRLQPIYFMRFCEATPEMVRAMNEGILDFHAYSVSFEVFGTGVEAAYYAPPTGRAVEPSTPATAPSTGPPAAEELPPPGGGQALLFSAPTSR